MQKDFIALAEMLKELAEENGLTYTTIIFKDGYIGAYGEENNVKKVSVSKFEYSDKYFDSIKQEEVEEGLS